MDITEFNIQISIPTEEDPYAYFDCEIGDVGHADKLLMIRCDKIDKIIEENEELHSIIKDMQNALTECLESLEVVEVWAPEKTREYIEQDGRKERARNLIKSMSEKNQYTCWWEYLHSGISGDCYFAHCQHPEGTHFVDGGEPMPEICPYCDLPTELIENIDHE